MSEKLLDKINYPSDLRKLKKNQLEQVSNELRTELIDVVSETGGFRCRIRCSRTNCSITLYFQHT